MFIRKTKKTNGDKDYFNYQLVESYRTERGPRQRILLSLGSELPLTKEECKLVANRIEELQTGQASLVPLAENLEQLAQKFASQVRQKSFIAPAEPPPSQTQSVDLSSLEHEDARFTGIETITYQAIKTLRLEDKLKNLGLTPRQIEISIGVIIHRLANPGSERFAHQWLTTLSGLEEVMQSNFKQLSKNSLYKTGDILLSHKSALETFLEKQQEPLFHTQDTLFLYDLTNTYFEGRAAGSPKAKRGVSKEKRFDAPLVTLGLVVNQDGFAKRSRIFEGNISEPQTLKSVIEDLYADHRDPLLCLDAGIATKENLRWLREKKIRYLTVEKHRRLIDLEGETTSFKDKSGQPIRTKLIQTEEGIELHCHSEARQQKEQAIQTSLRKSFEEALHHAHQAIWKKGGMKRYDKVLQRVGRLKEKFRSISAYYDITVPQDSQNPTLASGIHWEFKQDKARKKFGGCYILKGWGVDLSAEELWRSYITLTEVESAFRSLKTDLGLRPIYHQKDARIDAHLFITILAYHVLHAIRYQLNQRGLSHSWETLRRIFSTQVRVTTTLKGADGRMLRIRSTTKPTADQREIYQALGMTFHAHKLIFNQ